MSAIDDIAKAIRPIVPTLAAGLASTNPISAFLYTVIAQVFGANKNNPSDVLNSINADPEAALKLKKIQFDHEDSIQNSKLYDRENARDREVELTKITGKRDYIMQIISILVVLGFFIICALMVFSPESIQDKSFITTPLAAAFMIVIHYYF